MKMNWDYIAGFFDGEGSVSISYRANGNLRNVILSISQCQLEVLEQIRDFVGEGKIDVNHHKGSKTWKKHWKTAWHFRISNRPAVIKFLEKIQSKIIVKKDKNAHVLQVLKKAERLREERTEDRKKRVQLIHRLRSSKSWKEIGEIVKMPGDNARKFYAYHAKLLT